MEGKDQLLLPKWDSLYKHASHKKPKKNIGIDVKKGDWYYSKVSRHAKIGNCLLFIVVNLFYTSCKWCCWRKGMKSCTIFNCVALDIARTSYVGI
jgi:hypothetical protein